MLDSKRAVTAMPPLLLLLLVSIGCGSATISPGPTPPPGPTVPLPPVADVSGNWAGTVESDNFAPRSITLVVVQAYSCVDGGWTDPSGDWKGAISGLTNADSFAGQISLERTAAGGGKCIASATISGSVDGDTFRWKADPLKAAGPCDGDLPQNLVLSVRKQ